MSHADWRVESEGADDHHKGEANVDDERGWEGETGVPEEDASYYGQEKKRDSNKALEYSDGVEGANNDEEEDLTDDDDEEPTLKYQRLSASVTGILKTDSATCLATHEKFLVLGTKMGHMHLLDLNGNEVAKMSPHSSAINDLSIDGAGDFGRFIFFRRFMSYRVEFFHRFTCFFTSTFPVGSCSEDGFVLVTNLYTKQFTRHNYHLPVKAVALPSSYKSKVCFNCNLLINILLLLLNSTYSKFPTR
jgi:hypothetical protein